MRRGLLAVAAVVAGVTLGWVTAGRVERHYRRDLFHPRAHRRLAALGWLEGQPGAETLRLLRDYLVWERVPLLQRRAGGLLRRFEATL
ncbi:MAG TPA: hypothetical protein VJU15_02730 [Gemmatimonadales bacterium]|nr:hypothetical protein [Gemmatimonadales bacterium]